MEWRLDADHADEQFLLELLNTTPTIDGNAVDELATADAGRDWLSARGRDGAAREWRAVRAARNDLQSVVRGDTTPAKLSAWLEGLTWQPQFDGDDVRWAVQAPAGRTAATAAVLAWSALLTSNPGRLRPCANPECRLFLIDHSKPNRARWCSMAVCGNRMKARRHYNRVRQSSTHDA
ncbi:CGNR zinc finger domain-containing protein [Actinoplanes sp. NPDC049596]|uniref:CGNR zinc finger domain-containing protein n=1 Tax=unclassified Actinoplanes TaxID=2626549 RepID=UPI00343E7E02